MLEGQGSKQAGRQAVKGRVLRVFGLLDGRAWRG